MNRRDKENKVYFSRKLTKAMEAILTSRCTVINAPFGYGKTTSLRAFLEQQKVPYDWIECTFSKEIFWEHYCEIIENKIPQVGKILRENGYPVTPKQLQVFCRCAEIIPDIEKTFLIIDNFHLLEDEIMDFLFLPNVRYEKTPFSVVLVTEGRSSKPIQDMAFKNQIHYLSKNDFVLETPDIKEYLRNYNIGVDIEEAQRIYNWSSGWIVILQAYVRHYKKHHNFHFLPEVYSFINHSIWENITPPVQRFFVHLSIFDNFTVSLAETVNQGRCENLTGILEAFPYLELNEEDSHYSFYPLIKSFLYTRFKELSHQEKAQTCQAAAEYYIGIGEFFYAIILYYECGDFKAIFSMRPYFYSLYNYINNKNRIYFLTLSNKFWTVERKGTHAFTIMLAFIMFLYGEKETMRVMCEQIETDIQTDDGLSSIMKSHYLAELEFAKSYLEFNDFGKMMPFYQRAYEYSKIPIHLLSNRFPCTFGMPSVLAMFFNSPGTLQQTVDIMEQEIDVYYMVTHGHAKGMAALFRAE